MGQPQSDNNGDVPRSRPIIIENLEKILGLEPYPTIQACCSRPRQGTRLFTDFCETPLGPFLSGIPTAVSVWPPLLAIICYFFNDIWEGHTPAQPSVIALFIQGRQTTKDDFLWCVLISWSALLLNTLHCVTSSTYFLLDSYLEHWCLVLGSYFFWNRPNLRARTPIPCQNARVLDTHRNTATRPLLNCQRSARLPHWSAMSPAWATLHCRKPIRIWRLVIACYKRRWRDIHTTLLIQTNFWRSSSSRKRKGFFLIISCPVSIIRFFFTPYYSTF